MVAMDSSVADDLRRICLSIKNVSTLALFGLASEQLHKFRDELMSSAFLDRVPPFKHNVTRHMKREPSVQNKVRKQEPATACHQATSA
jgi:hypothetical protein